MNTLPENLLPTIAWDFSRPRYVHMAGFRKAAEAVQLTAFRTDDHWRPGTLELGLRRIRVRVGMGRGERMELNLRSTLAGGFTTEELLFTLHEAVHTLLKPAGRCCLHSLTLAPESEQNALLPPLYVLRLAPTLARALECVACVMAKQTGSHEAVRPDWRPEGTIAEDFYAA